MTVKPHEAEGHLSAAAGAVLLWCVLSGALVLAILLLEPASGRGLEFWTPAGALRFLADLAMFYVIFLVPPFAWRKRRPLRASVEAGVVVLFTAALGLALLDRLVGLGAPALARLIVFLVLAGACALVWDDVLRERSASYYSAASLAALGVPIVAFFCEELFRVRAGWLDCVSPFTAWRLLVDSPSAAGPWIVFGLVLIAGLIVLAVRRGRAKS